MSLQRKLVLVVAGLGIVLGALASFALQNRASAPPALTSAIVYSPDRELPSVNLQRHDGEVFDPARLSGRWSLFLLGFTNCPDVCPTTLSVANEALSQLAANSVTPPDVYFITVDPERDTPEHLGGYVGYFNPAFTGVLGSPEALNKLTFALSAVYSITRHEPGDTDYVVDHTSALWLVNPKGRVHAVFPGAKAASDAASVAQDLHAIISSYGS